MNKDIAVSLIDIHRSFGDVKAVDGVNLDIRDGEFFTMLGPSGSGKTTCLRLIAGFERPDSGKILLHGQDVSHLPPYERDVNTVFQDYALFPHMSVGENIAYGLMIKKVPMAERQRRVKEMLELVQLPGLEQRKPSQLSGGQRQRVALARALINHPSLLLLDEPLGALDLKLRQQMQLELKSIQQRVGITFIYVTHDQEEALTMSDRLAVFNQGIIEQVGEPHQIYEHPHTTFVAGFVGVSNLIDGELARRLDGSASTFSVRPEKIRIVAPGTTAQPDECASDARVRDVVYLGLYTRYLMELHGGGDLIVVEQNLATSAVQAHSVRGQQVKLIWKREHNRPLTHTQSTQFQGEITVQGT
jgi:putative spermidine/putrescine transport system ATP-binding protein